MKKSIVSALAILASLAAAPAMAESFTRDGVTYTYEIKAADGYQVISGNVASGAAFRLRVKDGAVSGRFGGAPVNFKVADVETGEKVSVASY